MTPQGTPLYGVLTWFDDTVADGVYLIVGWAERGGPVASWDPVAVRTDGHNGPAIRFATDLHCEPWLDYFVDYAEAAQVVDKARADGHMR